VKNLFKFGVAGALALGGSMAAQAAITVPNPGGSTFTGNPGDLILFADIFNGTTLVKAYAGDTGMSATNVAGGTGGTFADANLTSFLSYATSGTTVVWALEAAGGTATNPSSPVVITSASNGATISALSSLTGYNLNEMGIGLQTTVQNLNGEISLSPTPTANSLYGTMDGSANTGSGTNFNASSSSTANDNHVWYGLTGSVATNGLGSANLYLLTAADQGTVTSDNVQQLSLVASLSSSGLSLAPASVPLPAAVWLFGSGLLGLAGIARRKVAAA